MKPKTTSGYLITLFGNVFFIINILYFVILSLKNNAAYHMFHNNKQFLVNILMNKLGITTVLTKVPTQMKSLRIAKNTKLNINIDRRDCV